ncbi:MAG: 4Fe-4S binding protein, partial [Thermodesulfovibrionales bacterium]|nr:4Fe-4S binding protein [Thermodesulfovibrionales bacterium]
SKKGGEFMVKDFPMACIDIDKCSKCSTCITQCPCKAIDINENRIKIIEELCEGCGSCVASCPSNAIELEGFTKEQIITEINGILSSLEEG